MTILEENIKNLNNFYKPVNVNFKLDDKVVKVSHYSREYYFNENTTLRDNLKSSYNMQFNKTSLWYIPIESLSVRIFKFEPKIKYDRMVEMLYEFVDTFSSVNKKKITDLLAKYPYFFTCPAAKSHHHNYKSGLLEHTLEVLTITNKICDVSKCDKELVLVGALIHDIGKMLNYKLEPDGTSSMIEENKKLSHSATGCGYIQEFFGTDEYALKLMHIIASHHGHKEWDAITTPETIEAVIVHTADLISSRSIDVNLEGE